MKNLRRFGKTLVLTLIVFAIFMSLFFITHVADHDCIGDGCPVCYAISGCLSALAFFGKIFVFAFAFLAGCSSLRHALPTRGNAAYRTPVSMKVKLTD